VRIIKVTNSVNLVGCESLSLIVTGGRSYEFTDGDREILSKIHELFGIRQLIHGCCTGADSCAKLWAEESEIDTRGFPVTKEEWRRNGKKAGPIRNAAMLKYAIESPTAALVAFPGGNGTADMRNRAIAAGIVVFERK